MRQTGPQSVGAVLGGAVALAAAMCYYLHLHRFSTVVRRAAFDIGSGYTKMLVADVKDGAIVGRVVLGTEVKLSYKVDAQQSADGSLSAAIQTEGLECFRRAAHTVQLSHPKPRRSSRHPRPCLAEAPAASLVRSLASALATALSAAPKPSPGC